MDLIYHSSLISHYCPFHCLSLGKFELVAVYTYLCTGLSDFEIFANVIAWERTPIPSTPSG